jgi:hypothetical protein
MKDIYADCLTRKEIVMPKKTFSKIKKLIISGIIIALFSIRIHAQTAMTNITSRNCTNLNGKWRQV